jgi:hypothetical protein
MTIRRRKPSPVLGHVMAECLKRLRNDQIRLSPETHAYVMGKTAAALKAAYPKLSIEKFLRACQ